MTDLATKIRNAAALNLSEIEDYHKDWRKTMTGSHRYHCCVEFYRDQHAQNAWAFEALEEALSYIKSVQVLFDLAMPHVYRDGENLTQIIYDSAVEVEKKIAALVPKGDHE
jgi:hypothetical protein